ncbi:helix-turn-helix domain-containing protein, partial [Pseudonocardia abyssalis]|nr:helix-turn-helix transcriptional regulator [Pseudonocardia abyssalis]
MATTPLSERLRALRLRHWPDQPVNQSRVAKALGVTGPSISAYENGTPPPTARLRDYAIF